MHYGNGREAKNGDKVVLLGYGGPVVGILYDAHAGNDYCNGKIAATKPNDPCPNLKECLHLDDVLALFPADQHVLARTHPDFRRRVRLVPDISQKTTKGI
jgi:hypothetical protein